MGARLLKFILFLLGATLLLYYGNTIIGYLFLQNFGTTVTIISITVNIALFLYYKNEKVYLWANRNIFFWFKSNHSKWKFLNHLEGKISNEHDDKFERIKKSIIKAIEQSNHNYTITKNTENRIEFTFDDEILLRFDLGISEYKYKVDYRTNRFTVPWSKYEERIDDLSIIFGNIERCLSPTKKDYQIILSFEDSNPYYGFFIKHIPQDLISDFSCTFSTPKGEKTQIKAGNSNISIQSGEKELLRKYALDYLALNETLVTNK